MAPRWKTWLLSKIDITHRKAQLQTYDNAAEEGSLVPRSSPRSNQRLDHLRAHALSEGDDDGPEVGSRERLDSWRGLADSHSDAALLDRGSFPSLSSSTPPHGTALVARARAVFHGEGALEPDHAVQYFFCWTMSVYIGLCLLFGLSIVIACLEKWSALEAIYFCVVTITTVGYGDTVPASKVSKVLCCILISASLLLVATAFARMQHMVMRKILVNNTDSDQTSGERRVTRTTPAQRLLVSCILLIVTITSATCVLVALHEFDVVDALYFVVMTMTTVGYGDVSPEKKGGRIFTVVFCILGPLLLGRSVTSFVEMHIESIDLLDEALALHHEAKARALAHVDDSFDIRNTDESLSEGSNDSVDLDDRGRAGSIKHDHDGSCNAGEEGSGSKGGDVDYGAGHLRSDKSEDGCSVEMKLLPGERSHAPANSSHERLHLLLPSHRGTSGDPVSMDKGETALTSSGIYKSRHPPGQSQEMESSIPSPFLSPVGFEAGTAAWEREGPSAEFALGYLLLNGSVNDALLANVAAAWREECDGGGADRSSFSPQIIGVAQGKLNRALALLEAEGST